ncbi:hypothetical protein HII31_01693 [Pseudocercospora fuligena]|uniref:Uncharacterized protein n=1 Tax=Pseudocercospora fuligena TaxID=685502 RepID=A0A8H6VLP0_9PEZI|nr:hypothetical protein HII31_01693 [Pseudocercospora fuligena]
MPRKKHNTAWDPMERRCNFIMNNEYDLTTAQIHDLMGRMFGASMKDAGRPKYKADKIRDDYTQRRAAGKNAKIWDEIDPLEGDITIAEHKGRITAHQKIRAAAAQSGGDNWLRTDATDTLLTPNAPIALRRKMPPIEALPMVHQGKLRIRNGGWTVRGLEEGEIPTIDDDMDIYKYGGPVARIVHPFSKLEYDMMVWSHDVCGTCNTPAFNDHDEEILDEWIADLPALKDNMNYYNGLPFVHEGRDTERVETASYMYSIEYKPERSDRIPAVPGAHIVQKADHDMVMFQRGSVSFIAETFLCAGKECPVCRSEEEEQDVMKN